MAVFEASVELACSPEAAFEFLAQPENIRLITPSSVMLVFDAAPKRLSLAARMEFRVQAMGSDGLVSEWSLPAEITIS